MNFEGPACASLVWPSGFVAHGEGCSARVTSIAGTRGTQNLTLFQYYGHPNLRLSSRTARSPCFTSWCQGSQAQRPALYGNLYN